MRRRSAPPAAPRRRDEEGSRQGGGLDPGNRRPGVAESQELRTWDALAR
ncbi:MAG: hypothetical protein QW677_02735 [Pyrobaculum sp.]